MTSSIEKTERLIREALADWAAVRRKYNLTDDMIAYGNKILADAKVDSAGAT